MSILYHRGIGTFNVSRQESKCLERLEHVKVRGSVLKLYLYLRHREYSRRFNKWTSSAPGAVHLTSAVIEKQLGMDRKTLVRALRDLEELGFTSHTLAGRQGGYEVNIPPLPTAQGFFEYPTAALYSYTQFGAAEQVAYLHLMSEVNRRRRPDWQQGIRDWGKRCGLSVKSIRRVFRGFLEAGLIGYAQETGILTVFDAARRKPMRRKGEADPFTREVSLYYEHHTQKPEGGFQRTVHLFCSENTTPEDYKRYLQATLPERSQLTEDVWAKWQAKQGKEEATDWVNLHCPFHDDKDPSFAFNLRTGFWKCMAGCYGSDSDAQGTIDLELLCSGIRNPVEKDKRDAVARIAKKMGKSLCRGPGERAIERYEYTNEDGVKTYSMLRFKDGSGSFRHWVGKKSYPGLGWQKRTLYRLPEVIAADVVIIVEGERKAERLRLENILDENGKPVAVTTSGDAHSWQFPFVDYLHGKKVLLMLDSDNPGLAMEEAIIDHLSTAGIEHIYVDFTAYGKDFRACLDKFGPAALYNEVRNSGCDWLLVSGAVPNEQVLTEVVQQFNDYGEGTPAVVAGQAKTTCATGSAALKTRSITS